MISEKQAKKFCKDYTKIENYEAAVNDKSQVWHCHHILGEILTRQQLLDHDFYYDVPPCMLKFVTSAEHRRLHNKGLHISDDTRRKMSEAKKGTYLSEEHRSKISESMKAKNLGKHLSDETRRKMSESRKGKHPTDETRRKISEALKRRCAANK